MAKFRVGYIDMVRGGTLLWVECSHFEFSMTKPLIEKPILAIQDIQVNTNCHSPGKN